MTPSLQNFSTMVSNAAAAAQGACKSLLDFTTGSVSRSLMEANATVALWLQYLLLQVLATTRLASSYGDDVDSWIAQFGMSRLGATAATTTETFICLAPQSSSAVVPVGAIVKSSDGTISFSVVSDTSNPYWSTSAGGYIRAKGVASITCPVQCLATGTTGNVTAGVLNLLGTQISGIDTCSNLAAATNGSNQESDAAVKARVTLWFASLSSATLKAVEGAIAGVSSNLTYQVIENTTPDSVYRPGFFFAAIDDGSGDAPDATVASVEAAIEAQRACGVETATIRAALVPAVIVVPVTLADGVVLASAQTVVESGVLAYVNALAVGATCSYTRISSAALTAAGALVKNVGIVTVNGAAADIGGATGSVVRAASVAVTLISS